MSEHSKEQLKELQSYSLERKISLTQARLLEWKRYFDDKIYISFSGGKDSTVLADIAARIYKIEKELGHESKQPLTLCFVNTGLEYPEIQKFVKKFADWLRQTYDIPVDLEIVYPKQTFKEVITEQGYPFPSKEQSKFIREFKTTKSDKVRDIRWNGNKWGMGKISKKWRFLVDADFDVSDRCCDVMKKRPAAKYEKESGNHPVLAVMAEESIQRQTAWVRQGCNAFEGERPKSKPMAFWTEQDVLEYLKVSGIPYCEVYGDIVEENGVLRTTGCDRTGCMFCMFGVASESSPNRFERMKETHPKQYNYCINGGHYEEGKLKPDKEGLGIGKILDEIGKPY